MARNRDSFVIPEHFHLLCHSEFFLAIHAAQPPFGRHREQYCFCCYYCTANKLLGERTHQLLHVQQVSIYNTHTHTHTHTNNMQNTYNMAQILGKRFLHRYPLILSIDLSIRLIIMLNQNTYRMSL